ncbi:MAG TPA: NtaA/DmoA family FMN-dependent monooxygenase [Ilumatobacter sp.]|nr:NtaA/DmoA family FMN-dependent monooxygenase [Ilumatobacter sp.]
MSGKPFHLGWFTNFTPDAWDGPWASADGADWSGSFYVDMAKALERACFDYIILEDTVMVADAYGGTMEGSLKNAVFAPKHDPVPLAALLAGSTSRLGIVATMSTSFYPPYMLARVSATIDHMARGRFGWNIVSSAEDRAAQNFGMVGLPEHDERYDMADEYFDVVCQLWDGWEEDAVVMDRETHTYADFNKVHVTDHVGKYYKVRGPLNTVRPPQGRPVFVQAGASPRGREFASKSADSIIAVATGIEGMKAYRDDVRARMEANGRNPDDCKVLFVVSPILGATTAEAEAEAERITSAPNYIEQVLVGISSNTEIDFAQYALDEPLPEVSTNGERGSLNKFLEGKGGTESKTLRQLAMERLARCVELIGTPEDVADKMGEVMEAVGGDGFLISRPGSGLSRKYISEVTDGLIPALQRRGLARTAYTHEHFRDNLRAF